MRLIAAIVLLMAAIDARAPVTLSGNHTLAGKFTLGGEAAAAGGGGGASAFTFIQSKSAVNDGGSVTSITMDAPITAGRLVLVWIKHEAGAVATPTSVGENAGNAFTALTERTQESGDLVGMWWYLLVADGGSAQIDIAWTGTAAFTRVIALEYSYGGTASLVVGNTGVNGADSGTSLTSATVSNSGTHRLNVLGYGGYSAAAVTSPQIGGVAGDVEPNSQVSDTWTWWNNELLSSENATGTSGGEGWIMYLVCFAAN